jgi:hypothetical protein
VTAYDAGLQQAEREAEVRERGALIDVRSSARALLVALAVGRPDEVDDRRAALVAAINAADDATTRAYEATKAVVVVRANVAAGKPRGAR